MTAAIAVLLIPLTSSTAPISFTGDLILLAYLLGLGRFFTALAALDTGSAFEGMGAAREVTFACLAEPAFFLGLLVLAKLSGSLQAGRHAGRLDRGALVDSRGVAGPGPAQLVHRACWWRTGAFPSTIPTRIWN